jgi:hypothetical protein
MMKVGQVYKNKNTNVVIPLSEPDIDGKALYVRFLMINDKINKIDQNVILNSGVNNTAKAVQIFDNPNFKFEVIYQEILEKDLQSTYVNSSELALAVGDRYQYVGKKAEYTVLCFFMRMKNPKTQVFVPFAFGVNLADVISFVNGIVNTKQGIQQYLKGPSQGLTDAFQISLKAIFFGASNSNSELTYWTIADPKLPKVIYIKQPKPKKQIQLSPVRVAQLQSPSSVYINAMPKVIDDTDEAVKNFNAVDIDIRSSSLLLDRFRYVVYYPNAEYADENAMRLFGGGTELILVYVGNLIDLNKAASGIVFGNKLLASGTFGQFLNVRKSNAIQVREIDRYIDLIDGNALGTIGAVDLINTVEVSQLNTPVVLNSAMMYFGAGNFIDVEQGMGKYGVGDEFHITPQDPSGMNIDFVILYSFQVKNKKTGLEIGYRCIKTDFLRVAGDTVNFSGDTDSQRIYYIDILQSQLDEKLESGLYDDFVSHRETRLKIYEAYTQEVTTAPTGPALDTFATFKEILGDQYDDDFLAVVAALDWQKINALRQKDPTTLDAIKQLIEQIYVDYLIEKDFTPSAQKNSTNAGDVNSAAFVYPINDISQEDIVKRLEHINKAYLDREIFPRQLNDEPFPKMNLAEFGELFMDVIGEKTLPRELIWQNDKATVNLYMNKGVEPAVNLSMFFARYSSDGDVKLEFTGIYDFGYERTKGIEYTGQPERLWGYVNNYPQKYYAAYVMYWLSVYTLPVEDGSVLLFKSETKGKQVLPLVTSQFALNELRYFNSLGLFPTPEVAVDYIKEIASNNDLTNMDTGYFGRQFKFMENWLYSNTTSKVTAITKFDNITIKIDATSLFLLRNDAEIFIKQLKAIDVDWGNPNAVYEPVVTTTTTTPPIKRVRQPKKPKLKFEEWKEPPSHFKELIEKAYDGIGALWLSNFVVNNEHCVFVNFVALQEGNSVLNTRMLMERDGFALFHELDFVDDSEVLIHQFQDDFSQAEMKLYEKINYPIGNIVFRLAIKLNTTQGAEFIEKFKAILQATIDGKAVTVEVPKNFAQWVKSESYSISRDVLRDQLMLTYETDGIDLYNTIFSYKNDNYTYFSLLFQPRLVGNTMQVNASKDLQAYAMIAGYSQLSTSFTTDYEQIFTDELTKGAASFNRDFRTLGVVIPPSEENRFIDGYYDYLKAQVAQRVVPPTPPAPPEPPKPKVKKVVTPTPVKQTKVEKLSQKYDDLDIDF